MRYSPENYPAETDMLRIVVMARWPSPGRCKRRLSLDLRCQLGLHHSGERAMRIQRKLTEHTVAVLHSMADQAGLRLELAVSGTVHPEF